MKHQRVAVGVLEGGHVTDGGVERLTAERDAPRLELRAGGVDVLNVQPKPKWSYVLL